MRLIPEQEQGEPRNGTQQPEPPPQTEQVVKGDAAISVQDAAEPAGTEATRSQEVACTPAKAKRRRRTGAEVAPRQVSDNAAGANTETPVVEDAVPDAPEVMEASGEAPEEFGDQTESVVRRPRTRQPKEPRWATAGRERRGRLK